jgi:hypothetical protein
MLDCKRLTGEAGAGGGVVLASGVVVTAAAAASRPANAWGGRFFAGLGLVWRGWMPWGWSAIRGCGCVCNSHVHDQAGAVNVDCEVAAALPGGFVLDVALSKVGDR